jgi:hypothetical protein
MTDTSITDACNVTPLPVKKKRADSTAALRQRRSRAKRKQSVTVPVNQSKCLLDGQLGEDQPAERPDRRIGDQHTVAADVPRLLQRLDAGVPGRGTGGKHLGKPRHIGDAQDKRDVRVGDQPTIPIDNIWRGRVPRP